MPGKAEVLDAEEKAWRELCARFDALGPEDWLRPGACGEEWTPKDLLAHFACWHAECAKYLGGLRLRGEGQWTYPGDDDAFNADAHDRCRGMTLKEVRAMSGAARHRFREEIDLMADPVDEQVAREIAGSGHRHYADHIPGLDAFSARAGA